MLDESALLLENPWSADPAGFPQTGTPRDKLAFLLNYAVLAPSILGTEPWSFELTDESIVLRADLSRSLPVTDPRGRELMISCGAALFNLRVAAASYGCAPRVATRSAAHDRSFVAEVRLGSGVSSAADRRLRDAITMRRTIRGPFLHRSLSNGLRHDLAQAARLEGATLSLLSDRKDHESALHLAQEARRARLTDPDYRNELAQWVNRRLAEARDHASEARHRLGPRPSVGAGHTPEPLARPELDMPRAASVARTLVDADMEKGLSDAMPDSPVLALLTTQADNKESWLVAGQSLQRVLLVAAAEGASVAYLNAPIEVEHLRPRVARAFNIDGNPQIMMQIGYGGERSPTPRRPTREVVMVGGGQQLKGEAVRKR